MCYNIQKECFSLQKLKTKLDLLQICLKAAITFWMLNFPLKKKQNIEKKKKTLTVKTVEKRQFNQ